MKTLLLFHLIVAVSFTPQLLAQRGDSIHLPNVETIKFDPSRDPTKDVVGAVREAQRTTKRILLDVGGEWCKWCHYLDQFFQRNKDVADFMNEKYVVVKVNFSKENENIEFLSHYPKIPGYPHFFVLDTDGKLIHSQDTGKLESGQGHDRDKVLAFLKRWAL